MKVRCTRQILKQKCVGLLLLASTTQLWAMDNASCDPISVPSLSAIPDSQELEQESDELIFASLEIEGNRVIAKFVREDSSGRIALNMWRKFASRVPIELRESITRFNVTRNGDVTNFDSFINEETNEVNSTVSMAQFLSGSLGDVCDNLERRQFSFDWEMVRLLGQLYAEPALSPEQLEARGIGFDSEEEALLVQLFDEVLPRRASDEDLEETFPQDDTPKLNGRFVTETALLGEVLDEYLEAFTTFMVTPSLPNNRSRALATVRFMEDIPEFSDLKSVLLLQTPNLALVPLNTSDESLIANDGDASEDEDELEGNEFHEIENDFFLNFVRTNFAGSAITDPGLRGSYDVEREVYELGDTAITLDTVDTEVEGQGIIFYPSNIDTSISLPVILMLHGRYETCVNLETGGVKIDWPCERPFRSVPSYQGFNYLANHLASQGFFVVSISANGISAIDENLPFRQDAEVRAELIDIHLNMLRRYSQGRNSPLNGVLDADLENRLDFTKVGLLGHSRGGAGIAEFVKRNASKSSARFGVRAVMPVAPANEVRFSLSETSVAPVIPYCDADVQSSDGVAMFDDARYFQDEGESRAFNFMYLMMGANHNFFNTMFTSDRFSVIGGDDWNSDRARARDPFCGATARDSGRFSAGKQRSALRYYASAYFNAMLKGQTHFDHMLPLLAGHQGPLQSSGVSEKEVHESFHFPSSNRIDINRFTGFDDDQSNELGGRVDTAGVDAELCGFGLDAQEACFNIAQATVDNLDLASARFRQMPHERAFIGEAPQGVPRLLIRWNESGDYYETSFDPIDVSDFDLLNFRAGVQFDLHPEGRSVDRLRVTLFDINGNSTTVNVDNSEAMFFPPGTEQSTRPIIPKSILNTVKVSLSKFERGDVDLRNVTTIRFLFNDRVNNTREGEGALLLTDIAFSKF